MSKIYKLFVDENIKTWKKFSTKLAIIFIIIALMAALAFVKVPQYMEERSRAADIDYSTDWRKDVELDIEIAKEQLEDDTLPEEDKRSIEKRIELSELRLKYDINPMGAYWKNDIWNEIFMSPEIDEKLVKLIENDDFGEWVKYKKEQKKQQLENNEITKEQYDNEIFILNLREKYGIGNTNKERDNADWRDWVLVSDIKTAQESIRTGIDVKTNKVLTAEQKEEYENDIKLAVYKIENNMNPLDDGSTNNYRMIFETLATNFVIAMIAVFVIIVAGGAISTEISTGTIKFWALTPNKRWKILTAKILSILFYIVVITLVMSLLTITCANIFFDARGNEYLYVKDGNVKMIGNILFIIGYYFAKVIPIILFALFALMLSVITRNTSISLGLSIAVYMGNSFIMMIMNSLIKKDWMKFVPFNNLNIVDKVFPNFQNPMSMGVESLATSTSLGFSLAVLGVCAILMFVTMYDSFNKRDII